MMKGLRLRIFLVISSVVLGLYFLVPSILKFGFQEQISRQRKADAPWYHRVLPSEVLKLGLDLRGGIHIVLGIDFHDVYRDDILRFRHELEALIKEEHLEGVTLETTPSNQVIIRFPNDKTWEKVDGIIAKRFGGDIDFDNQTANQATVRMSALREEYVKGRAIEQSLETLRNRIDEFGIAEPIIQRHGEEKILVQFPGVQEIGRLKDIISRTAKLTFQIVRSGPERTDGPPPMSQLDKWIEEFVKEKKLTLSETAPITNHMRALNEFLTGKIPAETEVLFSRHTDINTRETTYTPYLLDKDPIVSGDELDDAYYAYSQETNLPEVRFRLNASGAIRFDKGTGDNVGGYMAIVLDGNVHSAPRINSRIPGGSAVIQMGGEGRSTQEILNDAKDTALVLRSGALPAKLQFLEERTIGPSLGADSIRAGVYSLGLGLALVVAFMLIYYRGSGMLAVVALVLNALFILSALAAFEGTLTLPGLAGITLTLGMAVDANVLIFEHIREEILAGKNPSMAIAEGYRRAFSAILDSNVTTIVAALVLLSFGYGPIRGFAVTLIIGLICSMYTAVYVTRVIADLTVVSKGKKTLSI